MHPSCESGICTDPKCCSGGYKFMWPNTLGMYGEQAKRIIEKDNPFVTAVIVHRGEGVTDDFCCNRVWVYVDEHGKVAYRVPIVG
ncbi:glu S.griseus protease inhibitor-like [Olea europaea var. sylvestris]|uniref:glu S.griseus protease inhibitor-like n=1 Tax=Olea europaea var. sylvestris TaxID=158386 RepID=UPI000C1D2C6C|nr:glu S.griseus protease inhibitor-like [Olea europaea var. sylvestris]